MARKISFTKLSYILSAHYFGDYARDIARTANLSWKQVRDVLREYDLEPRERDGWLRRTAAERALLKEALAEESRKIIANVVLLHDAGWYGHDIARKVNIPYVGVRNILRSEGREPRVYFPKFRRQATTPTKRK